MSIGVRIIAGIVFALAVLLSCALLPFIIAADMLGLKRYANSLGFDWEDKK